MTSVGVRTFKPSQPVGERCSHAMIVHDGRPDNVWSYEIAELCDEMDAIQHNTLDPRLSWAQHKDYWQQLKILSAKARVGRVRISEHRTAEAKVIRNLILELRPVLESDRPAFGRYPRRLRLYYGEPDGVPHCLLALHLDTKAADVSGLEEQNDAIEEALRRANAWVQAA